MNAASLRVSPWVGALPGPLSGLHAVLTALAGVIVVLGLVFAGSTAADAASVSTPVSSYAASSVDDPAVGASAVAADTEAPHPVGYADARHRSVSIVPGALPAPAVSPAAPTPGGEAGQPRSSRAPFTGRVLLLLLSINRT
ncbi:hypothetical protein [Subtercola boreus]|uniref:Uncharacterized protein n=1 Tax=Subtercola boreus TaxID=120213 RepID=A0A3E0WG23_9MICO|nr:hypothetical protein [Subtercola boreus]RFA22786.1 hypothetical protein B7R24_04070 [Subtercola boreus]RFA23141.1 hypothetical protein B7R23_04065 [Subtercola boreus]RFA28894.1 hypothetical protein B7R25_04080 [Subtercola boreus]